MKKQFKAESKKLLDMMNAATEDAKNEVPMHREMIERKERENPMIGNNPFMGGMSPFGPSPFESTREKEEIPPRRNMASPTPITPNNNQNDNDNDFGFDVDELVKKIDAKIAELEKEEQEEAKKKEQKEVPKKPETKEIESLDNKESIPSVENLGNSKPIAQQNNQVHNHLVLDDEEDDDFFDDFFDN